MSSEEIPASATGATPETLEAREASEAPARSEVHDLTDPTEMRALAHPVRMALLELLEVVGTVTATQASEVLGESPANCAFHLRTLAKYGYVAEAGGGKGRQRPWKLVHMQLRISDPTVSVTARTLHQVWLDRVLQRARTVLSGSADLPAGWRGYEQETQATVHLTAAETRQFGEDALKLLDRYRDRSDPSQRPAGALPVEVLLFAYPLTELAALAAASSPPQGLARVTPGPPKMSDPTAIMSDL